MAGNKRFYWIKLKENFFDFETIDWLKSQKNGCEYIVLYQQLCLISANRNGELFSEIGEMIIPYDAAKIARDTKFSFDTVVVALELFKKIGLIYEQKGGILKIPYVEEIVGSETKEAQKKRNYRSRKIQNIETKVDIVPQNVPSNEVDNVRQENRDKILDIRDKILDKDIDKETAGKPPSLLRHKYGEYQNVLLSDEEIKKLKAEFPNDYKERIDRVSEYVASTGKSYKNYLATIRSWSRRETPAEKKTSYNLSDFEKLSMNFSLYGDDNNEQIP